MTLQRRAGYCWLEQYAGMESDQVRELEELQWVHAATAVARLALGRVFPEAGE